jgi:hypothetical protein
VCASNVYDIELYECPNGGAPLSGIGAPFTCKQLVGGVNLQFCDAMKYVCYVTGGPSPPFTEPIYVEWHWTVEALHPLSGRPSYYTGKFVYVATVEWLNSVTGGNYPIPLLNQTNHTPK